MRTVFPNVRALGIGVLALCFSFTLLYTILYSLRGGGSDGPLTNLAPPLVRDADVRREVEKDKQAVEFLPPPAVIDKPKESLPHKSSSERRGVLPQPSALSPDEVENAARRTKAVEMMQHAWKGYRTLAWGANELSPITGTAAISQSIFGGPKMMATVVDGADTLWLMKLEKEYAEARDLIRGSFDIAQLATGFLSVFEVTIRYIGSFLSLYALTKERFYIDKARSVADALLPAFKTGSGLPYSIVEPRSGHASNYGWAPNGASILSEIGSLHLEWDYLSRLTNDPKYAKKVKTIRDVLERAEKKDGLYPNYILPQTGTFSGDHISLGALGDSFYEYLLKGWLISGRRDEQAYRMYKAVSEAIEKRMIFTSKGGLTYMAELKHGAPDHKMGHLACFAPGIFALQAHYLELAPAGKARVLKLAEELAHTCHESYARASPTHIGPEMFYFREGMEAKSDDVKGYILRPEAIESWFYLWRITKNKKYKEWVWNATLAIDKYCRVENGFVGLKNVYDPSEGYDDVQQSFFLAETLKYIYLTFADDVLPLDEWVFNTEAHPLPIITPPT